MLIFATLIATSCETDDPDTSDTSTDTSTDTSVDTAGDTGSNTDTSADTGGDTGGIFLADTGTIGGVPMVFACDEHSESYEFYATQRTEDRVSYVLGGACADTTPTYYVLVGAYVSAPASSDACVANAWGVGATNPLTSVSYNCALDGVTELHVAVDELEVQGDGTVIWGGSFRVVGDGANPDVDLTGSFRFHSAQ